MNKKNSYTYEELIDCANGKLFGHQSLFEVPLPVGNLGGVPTPVNGHFDFSFIFLKIVLLLFF